MSAACSASNMALVAAKLDVPYRPTTISSANASMRKKDQRIVFQTPSSSFFSSFTLDSHDMQSRTEAVVTAASIIINGSPSWQIRHAEIIPVVRYDRIDEQPSVMRFDSQKA